MGIGKSANGLVQLMSIVALDMQSFRCGEGANDLLKRLLAEIRSIPGMGIQKE
jgi:hypothetical protein